MNGPGVSGLFSKAEPYNRRASSLNPIEEFGIKLILLWLQVD